MKQKSNIVTGILSGLVLFLIVMMVMAWMMNNKLSSSPSEQAPSKPESDENVIVSQVNFSSGDQDIILTDDYNVLRSVVINALSEGVVIVNASGYTYSNTISVAFTSRCGITHNTNEIDGNHLIWTKISPSVGAEGVPFAATRGFRVNPGEQVFNLVCDKVSSESSEVHVADTSITAIFSAAQ